MEFSFPKYLFVSSGLWWVVSLGTPSSSMGCVPGVFVIRLVFESCGLSLCALAFTQLIAVYVKLFGE